ncbi:MAG: hypothetical protein ACK5G7_05665 [Erysipelotrichaceae bacterium]
MELTIGRRIASAFDYWMSALSANKLPTFSYEDWGIIIVQIYIVSNL